MTGDVLLLNSKIYHREVEGAGACGYGVHARDQGWTWPLHVSESEAQLLGARRCRLCWRDERGTA